MFRYEIWAAGKSQGHTTNPARLPMLTQRARDLNPGATPSLTITEVK